MAGRSKQPEKRQASLSFAEMKAAITKIDRRIQDLNDFNIRSSGSSDPHVSALEGKLDALLVEVFGSDTVEYVRYRTDVGHISDSVWWQGKRPEESQRVVAGNIARAKANLEAIKAGFLETLNDAGETSAGRTMKAYEGLELHPAIERAVRQLFRDGHYANAIEDSVKALNALVRLNSGIDDLDGSSLMERVFSPKNPILKFNDLADDFDRDEQRGFMMLFSGTVAGLRNPRAHKLIKDDGEKALEFIAFVSLLAKLADKAKK